MGTGLAISVGTGLAGQAIIRLQSGEGTTHSRSLASKTQICAGTELAVSVGTGLAVGVGTGLAVCVGTGLAVNVGTGLAISVGPGQAVSVGTGLPVNGCYKNRKRSFGCRVAKAPCTIPAACRQKHRSVWVFTRVNFKSGHSAAEWYRSASPTHRAHVAHPHTPGYTKQEPYGRRPFGKN